MDKVEFTVIEASSLYEVSRQKVYKDLKNGTLSKNRKGKLDLSELLRCYGEPKKNTDNVNRVGIRITSGDTGDIENIKQQLRESKEREAVYQEREQFYQEQIRSLTDSVKLLEHKKAHEPERKRGLLGLLFN
jgi:vacuolar-type H+-ATPase subunit I/STV1